MAHIDSQLLVMAVAWTYGTLTNDFLRYDVSPNGRAYLRSAFMRDTGVPSWINRTTSPIAGDVGPHQKGLPGNPARLREPSPPSGRRLHELNSSFVAVLASTARDAWCSARAGTGFRLDLEAVPHYRPAIALHGDLSSPR